MYISILLLTAIDCFSQTAIVDSVHPLLKGKLDGDKIRENYDHFEVATPTRKPTGKYTPVILSMFHSKNLYTKTALNLKETLKALDAFKFTPEKGKGYASMGDFPFSIAVPLFDSVPVIITAYGIDSQNMEQYRFRVLENKRKEILGWTKVRFFSPVFMHFRYNIDGSEQKQMAYLGQFNAPVNNSITVEVKNLLIPDTIYRIAATWIKRAPSVIATFSTTAFKNFVEVYKYQWKHDFSKPNTSTYYGDIGLKPVDSLLSVKNVFNYDENNLFLYLKDKVKSVELVEYNLIKDKDSQGWQPNTFDPNVIFLQKLSPGNYKLLLRYAFQRQTVDEYSFTIKHAWYQTWWFKLTAGLVSLLALFSIALLLKNRRQQARLKKQQIEQQLTQAEIKSIKSQFNPHFVFNALTSIQGLVTKNDMEAAHKYLNDFSMLLRNSLNQSEKELISLSEDIELIRNYLKLEQLRFGFEYEIDVDDTIDRHAIEVPVLLLQPVIENAVKHGIAKSYKNGRLFISYKAINDDLLITVEDNGDGFNAEAKNGLGLKLTAERVDLLNGILKTGRISWETKRQDNNTQVIFIFKNWLL
ncbi:sensor histidine kinase [Niabella hibiscisoli]|uniref:sensor histidine kinase n=1 Tax=Niabella hibiscisoli TaxID=1825928 RepID=UPI001F10E2D7|nr:histidine kinase [Niabella hibiscisoli]MCH5716127.1 histidine kinase [Niabella hibiscisoli]